MAQASLPSDAARPAGVPSTVSSKLQALRNKISMWLLIDGVSRILIVAAVLLFVWFLVDYKVSFDFYVRLVNLLVSCILLGYLIYRYLIVPFSTRVSDDALILAVEKHYGRDMGESLISAVQFSRMTNEIEIRGVSPELVRATIAQGTEVAGKASFGKVVDGYWLRINLAIFAVAAVLLGIYAYGATAFRDVKYADPKLTENQFQIGVKTYSKQLLGIAFDREVLLKDTPWPQDVYFAFNIPAEDKVMVVPRGDVFSLQVRVTDDSKYTADEIRELRINVIGPNGRFSEKLQVVRTTPSESAAAAPPEGEAASAVATPASNDDVEESKLPINHFLFEMPNVLEPFQFQIEAVGVRGDSDWFGVTLVDRPTVESLTLTTKLPEYAGGAAEELPAGAGPHHILAGSTLRIAGMANKPLSRVVIHGGDESHRIDLKGETEFAQELVFGKEFKSGLVSIELWDNEQLLLAGQTAPGPLESKRPTQFSLRVKADRAPDVVARLDGISGMVTPQVVIPFNFLIKDEFAVTDVQLHYEWKHEENDADADKGSRALDSAKDQLGQATIKVLNDEFDLSALNIPVGSGLRLFITAKDNDALIGPSRLATYDKNGDQKLDIDESPPVIATDFTLLDLNQDDLLDETELAGNLGKSTVFLLRVVTQAEVREELIRRQAEIRVEFERLYKQQQDYRTDTEVLRAASREADALTPKQRQDLLELQKNHKLLETNIGSVVRRMEDIAQEMQNNRLDNSESALLQKLQKNVIQPMQELAQGDVDKTMQQLDNVRSNSERPPEREQALDDAIAQQEFTEEKMLEILKNMAKTEGYQEAVNLFYEIVKEQERLESMTEEERQKLIQDILEGGDGGSEKP